MMKTVMAALIFLGILCPFVSFSEDKMPSDLMPSDLMMCTMDAKECPDGSYVSRIPPDCAFALCPGEEPPAKTEKGENEEILTYE